MITLTSRYSDTAGGVAPFDFVKVLTSSLVTTLAIIALGAATLPLRIGCGILAFSFAGLVRYPHCLPKGLLYEVAIADLIVRSKLTQTLPNLSQHWWHHITPKIILGGIPLDNYEHQATLKKLGVKAVYAVLEDFEATSTTFFSTPVLEKDWKKEGICYQRLNCQDMTAMKLLELDKGAQWLHRHISRDNTVYVHCKAGRGRSAMVVIAYLMLYNRMSLEQALQHVSSRRSVMSLRPCQMELLQQYAAFINRNLIRHSF